MANKTFINNWRLLMISGILQLPCVVIADETYLYVSYWLWKHAIGHQDIKD